MAGYFMLGSIGQAKTEDTPDIKYFDAMDQKESIVYDKILPLCKKRDWSRVEMETWGNYFGNLDSLVNVVEKYGTKIDSLGVELVNTDKESYKLGKEAQKLEYINKKLKIKRKYFPMEDFCEIFYNKDE